MASRDAYPRKNFEQRGRYRRKGKFPLETRLASAALRSKTRDLILEMFLAHALAQFAREIRRDKTSFFDTRFYRKEKKKNRARRLFNNRENLDFISRYISRESSKLYSGNVVIRLCEKCNY